MNYLADTHIFLWAILSSQKISKRVRDILIDPELTTYVSAISFWEISLKYQLGKIDLTGIYPDELPAVAKDTGFEILNLDAETAATFYKLPKRRNKDPFDRMLAWQAIRYGYRLLTKDPDFADYKNHGLNVVW